MATQRRRRPVGSVTDVTPDPVDDPGQLVEAIADCRGRVHRRIGEVQRRITEDARHAHRDPDGRRAHLTTQLDEALDALTTLDAIEADAGKASARGLSFTEVDAGRLPADWRGW